MMRALILMIQFMTRYPIPVAVDFTAARFVQGMQWMPLVGLLVALPAALCFAAADSLFGRDLAALMAVIVLILVTGGLHLDGIADTADGLFSYRSRERMLEIMRDSTLGTNGVIAVVISILFKFVLLRTMPDAGGVLAVLIMPILGRMALTWHAAAASYAREEPGIGDFVNQTGLVQAIASTLFSLCIVLCLLFLWDLPLSIMLPVAALLHAPVIGLAVLFAAYLTRRLGGITGDTIGATVELAEMLSLLLLFLLYTYLLP